MPMSVNTNVGAMTALQALNSTSKGLEKVQSRINSGLNVASTKDDSATFTIAQGLRGNLMDLKAISTSLSRAKSVTDVAVSGAEQISDALNQMQTLSKLSIDATAEDRAAYNRDFKSYRDQISTIINSSEFNGTNLLKTGGGSVAALQSLTNKASGTDYFTPDTLTLANQGLDLGTSGSLGTNRNDGVLGTASELTDGPTALKMVDVLTVYQSKVKSALSALGSASRAIDSQITFTTKLSDVLESGVGNLVDADLAKESAKLQALQVKQQLGVQALSIANQAPQTITSLFRS